VHLRAIFRPNFHNDYKLQYWLCFPQTSTSGGKLKVERLFTKVPIFFLRRSKKLFPLPGDFGLRSSIQMEKQKSRVQEELTITIDTA
jgi:hypothetical protein